jgi:capsule polysaccharide export protein KpsE/RkpR
MDLKERATELIPQISERLDEVRLKFGEDAVIQLDEEITSINYPVLQYPTKITSFNFDKNPEVEGTLLGIKGQYLIFDNGVINIRKFGSYEVEVFA